MKILFVTCWYPHPGFPHRGIFVKEQARAAARRGCEVKVFHIWAEYSSSAWQIEERHLKENGLESFSIVIHSRFHRFIYGNTPLMQFLGRRYYSKRVKPVFNPDLIQGNVIYQAGMIARSLAKYLSRPYVIAEHFSKLDWYFGNKWLSYRAKKAYTEAERVLAVSDFLAQKIRNHIVGDKQIDTVPNVVDTGTFHAEPNAGDTRKIELLMVMNYQNSRKRPELLLKALGTLPDEVQRKFRLTMIGRGNGKVEKETYRQSLGVKAEVTFLGEVEKWKVAQQMTKANFLVHPSEVETFGVVVAEALCCGLPCIVSRVGALPELLDNRCGKLLNNSIDAWKNTLGELSEGKHNFNRKEIADKYAGRFSYEAVGERLDKIYREILSGS